MKLMKKGFTLIEMLIVIVIIGILAAALIPQLSGVQGRARDIARQADLRNIAGGMSIFQVDHAKFPDGHPTISGGWIGVDTIVSGFIQEGYLISLPKDPQNDQYAYSVNNARTVFALSARSESAKKNANWGGSSLDAVSTHKVMIGTEALASEIKLCDGVKKESTVFSSGDLNDCTAQFPMYVYVE